MSMARFLDERLASTLLNVILYKVERSYGWPRPPPLNLTLSVTDKCNSRCRTCLKWRRETTGGTHSSSELSAKEYEKIFSSLGKCIFWVTVSGGEPYMRSDLPEICTGLQENCRPTMINIATNGLLAGIIETSTRRILENSKGAHITVNLSLDGIGKEHDAIRGIPGNYDRALATYIRLRNLKTEFSNLRIGIHSVVSRLNIQALPELCNHVTGLAPDSYITEIAENRAELCNMDQRIAPDPQDYATFVDFLLEDMRQQSCRDDISKMIRAFRVSYYQTVVKELQENREVLPCYAGLASAQIAPNGDVWPCAVLGSSRTLGNLRQHNYDFGSLWRSERAEDTVRWIKRRHCHCQLANAHYTNMLCDSSMMLRVLWRCLTESSW
jgi:radical SAM protein with 4Fe4S-binding SPASM domain